MYRACRSIKSGLQRQECCSMYIKRFKETSSFLVPIANDFEKDNSGAKYVPITRHQLVKNIFSNHELLTPKESIVFDDLTNGFDVTASRIYHPDLVFLKKNYDVLSPDYEGNWIELRREEKRRKESEFWFLQRLAVVMKKAHFRKLTKEEIAFALMEHEKGGVKVSVDLLEYKVLHFWALGHTQHTPSRIKTLRRWKQSFVGLFTGVPPETESDAYRRVVVAMRRNRDHVLYLKAFKDVPVFSIEQLLPNGKIRMSRWDKYMLSSSALLGGATYLFRSFYNASVWGNVNVTYILGGISLFILYQTFTQYINRRNAYLLRISQMLYYKSIANNRGLITLLINRAEDELFKDLLLVYVTLLTNRPKFYVPGEVPRQYDAPPSNQHAIPVEHLPAPSAMTQDQIDQSVASWLKQMTNHSEVAFESATAIKTLLSLDAIHRNVRNGVTYYQAVSISNVVEKLPKIEVVVERTEEFEVEADREEDHMMTKQETIAERIIRPAQNIVKTIKETATGKAGAPPEVSEWGKTDVRLPALLFDTTKEFIKEIRRIYNERKKTH